MFTQFTGADECGGRDTCILSFTSDQLRALDWVYKQIDKHKIASVNMSLGSGYHDAPCDRTLALTEMIERLKAKGVATVVAAGNDHYYDGIAEPACISSTISVAAENKLGAIDVAYSNRSPLVHFVAPGTDIVSTVPGGGYKTLSGTSMAAPHVAAAFAAVRSQNPGLTVQQIEAKLVANGSLVEDTTTGVKFRALSLVGSGADRIDEHQILNGLANLYFRDRGQQEDLDRQVHATRGRRPDRRHAVVQAELDREKDGAAVLKVKWSVAARVCGRGRWH
ncbi:S8 family peptidase [Methylobacterium oryzae]|uniref:S8 family peptidase n=1 Tax=Methylobacterium oryzae TaxID=334852 RepID=UPI002F35DE28